MMLMVACLSLALLASHGLRAQQRTARLLGRAQHELRIVLDSLPALVSSWDTSLLNRFSNAAHEEWFGISPKDFHGRHIQELIGRDRYLDLRSRLDDVLNGKPQTFEHTMMDVNGVERHIVSSYIPDTG